ncbi:unnamed protein product [Microthlaspi erraticum]|uniref:SGNH hydrolase-type esterase domain-containing protein n=1 Tax=Microthlaspi erraticum TaxID=1685480 RepID=A0A6D2IIT7_9BRAS|nr:unnamed protein product [Microthlaspi erraticum]
MPMNHTPFLAIFLLFLGLLRFDSFPGLEAAPGNLTSIPGSPGNLTSTPGSPGNLTSTPGSLGNLTSTPGSPGNLTSTPGSPGNLTSTPRSPGNLTLTPGSPGNLTSVPGLYVFGDSLVDVGNNNHLLISIARANYARNGVDFPGKKATGRFCNGKNAADFLAEKFGLPLLPPYLSLRDIVTRKRKKNAPVPGVNFASGGAGIFNSTDGKHKQAIPLSQQVNDWLSIQEEIYQLGGPSGAQIHLSKSLFIVVIGSNDLFDFVGSSKLKKNNDPQQYTLAMAVKLKEQLKRIHNSGARKFLILGVAQIGCTPGKRNKKSILHECSEEANMMASLYNEALTKMLQQLKQEIGNTMSYTYFDLFKAIQDIINNPTSYGFADVTSACCGNGKLNGQHPCLPLAKLCPDRSKYLFWDMFGHPTEAAAWTVVDLMLAPNSQYSSPLTLTQLVSS